jgi:hypothetical protein
MLEESKWSVSAVSSMGMREESYAREASIVM